MYYVLEPNFPKTMWRDAHLSLDVGEFQNTPGKSCDLSSCRASSLIFICCYLIIKMYCNNCVFGHISTHHRPFPTNNLKITALLCAADFSTVSNLPPISDCLLAMVNEQSWTIFSHYVHNSTHVRKRIITYATFMLVIFKHSQLPEHDQSLDCEWWGCHLDASQLQTPTWQHSWWRPAHSANTNQSSQHGKIWFEVQGCALTQLGWAFLCNWESKWAFALHCADKGDNLLVPNVQRNPRGLPPQDMKIFKRGASTKCWVSSVVSHQRKQTVKLSCNVCDSAHSQLNACRAQITK